MRVALAMEGSMDAIALYHEPIDVLRVAETVLAARDHPDVKAHYAESEATRAEHAAIRNRRRPH